MISRHGPLKWRSDESERFKDLAHELEEFGQEAAADPKVLTDLRTLHWHLTGIVRLAEADSPAVAERKRQGRISYLESELSKVRGASS